MTGTLKLWDSLGRSDFASAWVRKGADLHRIAERAKYAECLIDYSIYYYFVMEEPDVLRLDFAVGWDADKALKTAWEVHIVTGYGVIFDFNGTAVRIEKKP